MKFCMCCLLAVGLMLLGFAVRGFYMPDQPKELNQAGIEIGRLDIRFAGDVEFKNIIREEGIVIWELETPTHDIRIVSERKE